jgi:hypothetical protein
MVQSVLTRIQRYNCQYAPIEVSGPVCPNGERNLGLPAHWVLVCSRIARWRHGRLCTRYTLPSAFHPRTAVAKASQCQQLLRGRFKEQQQEMVIQRQIPHQHFEPEQSRQR